MSDKFYIISKSSSYYAGISATGRIIETSSFDDAVKFFNPSPDVVAEIYDMAEKFGGIVQEFMCQPTQGNPAINGDIKAFLNGYRDLVKRTGFTLLSNDYDNDTYCVSVDDTDTLLAIVGLNRESTDVTWNFVEERTPTSSVHNMKLD